MPARKRETAAPGAGKTEERVRIMRGSLTGKISALLAALLLSSATAASGFTQDKKDARPPLILFLSSYAYNWDSVPKQLDGFREAIGSTANVDYMFMNTKTDAYETAAEEARRKIGAAVAAQTKYDVVILGDDAALDFAVEYREELFSGVPLVFEGINSLEKGYAAAAADPLMTGVVEAFPIRETLALARRLRPKATRVLAISDSSESGRGSTAQFFACIKDEPHLDFEALDVMTMTKRELADRVRSCDSDVILLFLMMTRDAEGSLYSNLSAAEFLAPIAQTPIFKADELGIGYGMLGGQVILYSEMASIAGRMALKILNGVPVSAIPVETAPMHGYFDYEQAQRFGLSVSDFPEGSLFINKAPTYWETHKQALIPSALVSLLLLLIVIFAVLLRKKDQRYIRELDEKDAMLSSLVKNIPGGIAIYKIGKQIRSVYFSEGVASLSGRTSDEARAWGKGDLLENTIHQDDLARARAAVYDAVPKGLPVEFTYRMKHKNGSYVWVQVSAVKISEDEGCPLYYAVYTKLPDEAELYKRITDDSSTGVFVCDVDSCKLIYANEAVLSLLGSGGNYKGRRCYEFLLGRKTPCEHCHISQLTGNQCLTKEFYLADRDLCFIVRGKLANAYGRPVHIEYVTDISDINREKRRQQGRLEAAMQGAQAADRAKSDFLSRMSHDMRTPMNAIIGLTELARDSLSQREVVKDYLEKIDSSAKFLLRLINDCLDMEKIANGKLELHPAPYRYDDFMKTMRIMIAPLCTQKGITLKIFEKRNAPALFLDRIRFEQIFFNLLSNAVKFTPRGGTVELLCRNESFHKGILTCDFVVRDTGIGISEEFQAKMFKPFEQESSCTSMNLQGTGLGLSIVKSVVDLMGGTLTVKSAPGAGTEITQRLSVPVADGGAASSSSLQRPAARELLTGKRILLVEAHPLNQLVAKKMLESAGASVVCAENGRKGLDAFEASPPQFFSAILMDILMPVMTGMEAARAIRSLPREDARQVPIIAMTANAFDEDVKKSFASGMNAHLTKPVAPQSLFATLKGLMG